MPHTIASGRANRSGCAQVSWTRDYPLRDALTHRKICFFGTFRAKVSVRTTGKGQYWLQVANRRAHRWPVTTTNVPNNVSYLTVVNPAIKVLFACVTARMVLSAEDSRITWSSQDASEYG